MPGSCSASAALPTCCSCNGDRLSSFAGTRCLCAHLSTSSDRRTPPPIAGSACPQRLRHALRRLRPGRALDPALSLTLAGRLLLRLLGRLPDHDPALSGVPVRRHRALEFLQQFDPARNQLRPCECEPCLEGALPA